MSNVFAPLHEMYEAYCPSEETLHYLFKSTLNAFINNLVPAAAHITTIFFHIQLQQCFREMQVL